MWPAFGQFWVNGSDDNVANSLSAKKRMRQNSTRRAINRARKSNIKTQIRRFTEAIATNDVEKSEAQLRKTIGLLDHVAAKGTLHKNTVARRKSNLQKKLNAITTK